MKSHNIHNSLLGQNALNLTKLNDYKDWLIDKNFTKETIENYLATIAQYSKRTIDNISLNNFFHEILTKYQLATIRSKRNALASYTKFLQINIDWEKIKWILPSEKRKHFPTVIFEELELLKSVNTHTDQKTNERNKLILDFFWYLGIRVNELINIKHGDYCDGDLRILGKGNKYRSLPLPPFLIAHFNPYSKNFLFLTRAGKKLTKGQIRRNLKRKTQLAGIKKNISPHSFRRSLATNSYNLGIRLDTIQKQLGHTNLNTTLGYIHNDYHAYYQDCSKLWVNQKMINLIRESKKSIMNSHLFSDGQNYYHLPLKKVIIVNKKITETKKLFDAMISDQEVIEDLKERINDYQGEVSAESIYKISDQELAEKLSLQTHLNHFENKVNLKIREKLKAQIEQLTH